MAKKLMDTLQPRPNAADLDKIAEQIFAAAPPPHSTTRQPARQKTAAAPAEDENVQHRLTIDLPKWLVERLRSEGKRNGITVRGMILANLLEKYRE